MKCFIPSFSFDKNKSFHLNSLTSEMKNVRKTSGFYFFSFFFYLLDFKKENQLVSREKEIFKVRILRECKPLENIDKKSLILCSDKNESDLLRFIEI